VNLSGFVELHPAFLKRERKSCRQMDTRTGNSGISPSFREMWIPRSSPLSDLTSSRTKLNLGLVQPANLSYNYVTRSTHHGVVIEKEPELGHYSDPPLLVLASLANGPKHGHAMIEDIACLCGTNLGPGTLYGAIARLEQQGWIEPLPSEERRQPYRITAAGLRVLRAKLTTLHRFSKAGLERLKAL
jgi:DNA-binding MarR family transcriptional regulator